MLTYRLPTFVIKPESLLSVLRVAFEGQLQSVAHGDHQLFPGVGPACRVATEAVVHVEQVVAAGVAAVRLQHQVDGVQGELLAFVWQVDGQRTVSVVRVVGRISGRHNVTRLGRQLASVTDVRTAVDCYDELM